jgi:hypothetical protein
MGINAAGNRKQGLSAIRCSALLNLILLLEFCIYIDPAKRAIFDFLWDRKRAAIRRNWCEVVSTAGASYSPKNIKY